MSARLRARVPPWRNPWLSRVVRGLTGLRRALRANFVVSRASLLDGPVMNFLGVRSSRRTPSALRARAPGRSRGAPLEATRATPHRRRSGPRALGSARAVRRPRASGGRGHRAPAPRRMPRLNPPPTQQVAGRPRAPAFGGYPADPSVSAEHSALSLEVRAGDARDATLSTTPPLDPVPDPPPRAIERDRSLNDRRRDETNLNRNPSSSISVVTNLRPPPGSTPLRRRRPPRGRHHRRIRTVRLAPVRATHRVGLPRARGDGEPRQPPPRRGGGPLLRRRRRRSAAPDPARPRAVRRLRRLPQRVLPRRHRARAVAVLLLRRR